MIEMTYPGASNDALVRHLRAHLRKGKHAHTRWLVGAALLLAVLGAALVCGWMILEMA